MSLRQILQLGDTFYFFMAIDWSYEERERREERKEEDGWEARGEGEGKWRGGGKD